MPFVATPSRRRLAMVMLLALAVLGGVVRSLADNPSVWRDIGTLFMVLWLPVVGNLVGYFIRKLPRSAPPPTGFEAGTVFTPHMQATMKAVALAPGQLAALNAANDCGTVLVGRHGFTTRTAQPVAQWLSGVGEQTIYMELLRPVTAFKELPPGTAFHFLVGNTAVATGSVVSHVQAPMQAPSQASAQSPTKSHA